VLPGVGPLASQLDSEVTRLELQDIVQFPGFRTDVGALLAAADLVVLPSHREGLSIALLEAMAAKRPIVATDIGSNLEATNNDECAVIVPPGHPHRLADAIIAIVGSPNEAERLASRARQVWEERYTEKQMLDGYLSLYE